MRRQECTLIAGLFLALRFTAHAAEIPEPPTTAASVLAQSTASDWRRPDPENLLCLDFDRGRVVMELDPRLAPRHVANVKALVREGYFNGIPIVRVQDNYVVQWGDPDAADPAKARPISRAQRQLPAELEFGLPEGVRFSPLPDGDLYAPEVGFLDGIPIARDPGSGLCWPIHSYGMLGAGRDDALDSGGGTELYVVNGQAPRHLDRNVTLFGRVIQGMELLSALPRGTAPMGFYATPAERIPIRSLRVAADLPEPERPRLEILRTDTATFRRWVEARRNRREPWFHRAAGKIDISNLPIPIRTPPP
ncbi:MAG: peptidylprolyl isomerase [Verrucomicrobiales bacterium]|nr:peptidylprolyl isomerase [Verrucomicrobiales bacterium]